MIKDQAQRRGVASSACLLAIHLVQHAVCKVAPSLQEAEPVRHSADQVKVSHCEEDRQRYNRVYETQQGDHVWC